MGAILIDFVGGALAIYIAFMLFVKRDKATKVLDKDSWGYMFILLGITIWAIAVWILSEMLATIGGMLFGLGFLVALPKKATEWALWKPNVGLAAFFGGMIAFMFYGLGPIWPDIQYAFNYVWQRGGFQQAAYMFVGGSMAFVGLLVFVISLVRQTKKVS